MLTTLLTDTTNANQSMFFVTDDMVGNIIAFLAVIVSAWAIIDNRRNKKRVDSLSQDMDKFKKALVINGIQYNLTVLDQFYKNKKIREHAEFLTTNTAVDRVLFFVGTNGKTDMKTVYCIDGYVNKHSPEAQTADELTQRWIAFKVDVSYTQMIRKAKRFGIYKIDVSVMDDCVLKRVYESEGVTHAWLFIFAIEDLEGGNVAIYYCTIATHENISRLHPTDELYMNEFVDKIKDLYKYREES